MSRFYLVTPGGSEQVEQAWIDVEAARQAGVEHITKLGSLQPGRGPSLQVERWCRIEAVLRTFTVSALAARPPPAAALGLSALRLVPGLLFGFDAHRCPEGDTQDASARDGQLARSRARSNHPEHPPGKRIEKLSPPGSGAARWSRCTPSAAGCTAHSRRRAGAHGRTAAAGGMAAITRSLTDPVLQGRVERERVALKAVLDRRVARWHELARPAGLRYPRCDGGFFTTVSCDDATAVTGRLKGEGIFVVPLAGAIRVALCSLAERDLPRLVDGIARHVR